MLQTCLLLVITGLLWGGVYLLMASGLNLIYGVMKVVNLAHGDFIVIGGLVAVSLFTVYKVGPIVALPAAAVLLFVIGVIVHHGMLARLDSEGPQSELRSLLATFGLSYIVSNAALLIWGGQYQSIPFLQSSLRLGSLFLPEALVVCSILAFIIALGLQAWLMKTNTGRIVRATAQSALGAASCGHNVQKVRLFAFALGSAIAGAAGALVIALIPFQATSGGFLTVQAFTLIALGGLGNFLGAIVAALLLGVIEVGISYFFGSNAAASVTYLVFIAVVMFRPQGLLGQRGRI